MHWKNPPTFLLVAACLLVVGTQGENGGEHELRRQRPPWAGRPRLPSIRGHFAPPGNGVPPRRERPDKEYFLSQFSDLQHNEKRERKRHYCLSDSRPIARHLVCDGRFDCKDLSDEYLCSYENVEESNELEQALRTTFEQWNASREVEHFGFEPISNFGQMAMFLRLGFGHRRSESALDLVERSCIPALTGSENTNFKSESAIDPCSVCQTGEILCSFEARKRTSSTNVSSCFKQCVLEAEVCDGIKQCSGGEDEKYCALNTKNDNERRGKRKKMIRAKNATISCRNLKTAISIFKETVEKITRKGLRSNNPPQRRGCPDCDIAHRSGMLLLAKSLSALLSQNRDEADSKIINLSQRCDHVVDCDLGYDELMCPGRFYCESGSPLYVNISQTTDGAADCEDGSDEWVSRGRKKWTMASKDKMVRDWYVLFVMWFVGIMAVMGNSVVLVRTSADLLKLFRPRAHPSIMTSVQKVIKRSNGARGTAHGKEKRLGRFGKGGCSPTSGWKKAVKAWNSGLVLNLAAADFLMGLYLVVLGGISTVQSSSYWKFDKEWRTSVTCQALGVIVVISSQISVFSLVGLTTLRLSTVARPFGVGYLRRARYLPLICGTFWTVSFIIAIFPTLPVGSYYYATEACVPFPHVNPPVLNRDAASQLVKKLLHISRNASEIDLGSLQGSELHWQQMLDLTRRAAPIYSDWKLFGFYSAHSVCLPKLYVVVGDVAWQHTAIFLIVNFAAVVYICVAYIFIYKLSATNRVLTTVPSDKSVSAATTPQHASNMAKSKEGDFNNFTGCLRSIFGQVEASQLKGSALEKSTTRNSSFVFCGKSRKRDRNSRVQFRIGLLVVTDCLCWIPICIMGFLSLAGYEISSTSYTVSAIGLLPVNSALNPLLYSNFLYDLYKKTRNCIKNKIVNT